MNYEMDLHEGNGKRTGKKILFLSTLTPPFYGSAMSNEMCLKILRENDQFQVKNIKLNYSLEMSDVGKINMKKVFGIFQVSKQLIKLVKEFKPDVIYFVPAVKGFALMRDYFLLRIIRILKKGNLILHLRVPFVEKDWDSPVKSPILKDLLKCDKVIILGRELIGNLNKSVSLEDIYILPNAIPNTISDVEFLEIIKQRSLNSHLNLLFLSNMHESKGWFTLLQAATLLKAAHIAFTCHFVGEWPSAVEKKKFYNYVENNSLEDHVIYHGRLLGQEKKRMLTIADILIFPSAYEAFGRVIIEAMEFGLPVIANNTGTIPSIIQQGNTGYILENNTPAGIFENVHQLMDKCRRNEMGIRSRNLFLQKFTIETYKNSFNEIMNKC